MYPNPIIFGAEISWFPIFHWSGVIAAYLIGTWYYRRFVKTPLPKTKMLLFLLFLMPLALFGSRITGILEHYVASGEWLSWDVFLLGPSEGKFRWAGTILTLLIFIPFALKKLKIPNGKVLFDTIALSLAPLTAIVKQGCLFSGDGCYGIPTTLPWGLYFPYGPAPNFLPAHPTPIYDGVFHVSLFMFLIWWDKRKSFDGQTGLIYFLSISIFYIALEVIRLNPRMEIGLTVPQVTYIIVLLLAMFKYSNWKSVRVQL